MSTDLTNVNDHPVAILKREQELFQSEDMVSIVGHTQASQSASGIGVAIDTLTAYERANGVIFAALDLGALDAVFDSYNNEDDTLSDLRSAVSDLLGLE